MNKTITLDRLSLRNFKGMTYDLILNGQSADIYGQNKTGKTTMADAFCYLITGKNSRGQAKFDIKTNRPDGTSESRLEHEVTGVLNDNSLKVELRCVFHEVWKKVRGSVNQEMAGNTTDYYIDGVNVSETIYRTKIAEIFGDTQTFSLVSNPMYFMDLAAEKWETARALAMKCFSTLTDDQVFDSSPDLAVLRPILAEKRRTAEAHKTVVMAEQKRINDQIAAVPIRVDEVRRGLPDIQSLDRKVIAADIIDLETRINAEKLKMQGVDTGGGIASFTKQLAGINADLQKMESQHYAEKMKAGNTMSQHVLELTQHLNSDRLRVSTIEGDLKRKAGLATRIDADLAALREKWEVADAPEFQDSTSDTCAACGQALPTGRVQEAREKALAAFNQQKAERLEEISARGLRGKEDKEQLQGEIDALTTERDVLVAAIPGTEEQLRKLITDRDAVKQLAEDYTAIPARAELLTQRAEIEESIKIEREGHATDAVMIKNAIDVDQAKLTANKEYADRFTRREQGEQRIETLKVEEKKLAAEYERLEKEKFLCDKFIQEQARQMSDEINGHFRLAKLVMFETQINGGIKPTCLITEGGNIAGRGLNTGTMINVGVDICKAFSLVLGIRPPIVIDNAEAVTSWVDTDQQIIRFHASAGRYIQAANDEDTPVLIPDDKLRVELVKELVAA